MKKVYIFGVGKGKEIVRESLREENVELLGYIDNNASAYPKGVDGKKVITLDAIKEFDYIIVSVMVYKYIDKQLLQAGIKKNKVINFFSFNDASSEEYWCVLKKDKWRLEAMAFEFKRKVRPYSENLIYELADRRYSVDVKYPKILPAEDAVELICREHKSLSRFGDYEFELMGMKKRAKYQSIDERLSMRLKEIIRTDSENVIIAIADNYGSLEKYTQEAADGIREYLSAEVRQEHMNAIDLNKTYYDAYLSRPYIIYKDKESAGRRFEALRKIWQDKDVLIIEGDKTRMGVGNDLFDNALSIKRILAPSENAYSKYDEIYECAKKHAVNKLALIALGATATVLAYDLAMCGLWAVDIGHIDIEYEWYCAGVEERRDIPHKYVNEIGGGKKVTELPFELREKYEKEIICNLA